MTFQLPFPIILFVCVISGILFSMLTWAKERSAQGTETVAADQATLDPQALKFFETQIVPILKKRCYACHSHESGKAKGGLVLDSRQGWQKGGNEGPAIVPGQPQKSLLVSAIRYETYEMPPAEKLPPREIELLEQWIARGAPDPRQSAAGTLSPEKLWALQPITLPPRPRVQNTAWPRDELDLFILAKLEAHQLRPAADADRYTLLRRVTFDLTGLPPTPDEIDAFVRDHDDRAYEKVVDRLLNSPGFGDHWARHWFDLSCYADLADISGDMLIRDAWRYRDYVIRAFNNDKPLDRFIHEQIAGDLLPYASVEQQREQIIATGYLAIGPWVLQNYIKGQLAADVVDHQIDRIGRTFLAQTLSCARCHDHKFDPVPTSDYYALAGIFHSTRTTSHAGPGVWSAIHEAILPDLPETEVDLARLKNQLEDWHTQWLENQDELTPLLLQIPGATDTNLLTSEPLIAANEKGNSYELLCVAGPSVWANAAQATTDLDGLRIDLIREDGSILAPFRYQPGRWSGKRDAQQLSSIRFRYTGDGLGKIRIRLTSTTPGSGRFGGAIDTLVIRAGTETIFSENFDGLMPGSITGSQADTQLRIFALARIPGWHGVGVHHSHAVDLGNGNYAIQFYSGDTKILSQAKPTTALEKAAHQRAIELQKRAEQLTGLIAQARKQDAPDRALAVQDSDQPEDSRIYRRGDFQTLGEIVPRGFLTAIGVSQRYSIPKNKSGRWELAQWLTDTDNPLTPRVLVNRVWHHLFGTGLVRTVDYFGVHGETPSHPELLDFLSLRMRDEDRWSLKNTVRRMVLSRTYRMASSHHRVAIGQDPANRLLWRMPRRRLSAESIRDAMLTASGRFNPSRGGPSLGLELEGNIQGLGGNVNPPTWAGKVSNDVRNRRSVYLPFKRERPGGEFEILSVFDFPHPSDMIGARAETTVATQALFLMNAPFVKQQAASLASRLRHEEPSDRPARIQRLYLLTMGRPALPDEAEMATLFLDASMSEPAGSGDSEEAEVAAWTQLCHAVLGSNGFLFRE